MLRRCAGRCAGRWAIRLPEDHRNSLRGNALRINNGASSAKPGSYQRDAPFGLYSRWSGANLGLPVLSVSALGAWARCPAMRSYRRRNGCALSRRLSSIVEPFFGVCRYSSPSVTSEFSAS